MIQFIQSKSVACLRKQTNEMQKKTRENDEAASNCNETSTENQNDNDTDKHRIDCGDEACGDM